MFADSRFNAVKVVVSSVVHGPGIDAVRISHGADSAHAAIQVTVNSFTRSQSHIGVEKINLCIGNKDIYRSILIE